MLCDQVYIGDRYIRGSAILCVNIEYESISGFTQNIHLHEEFPSLCHCTSRQPSYTDPRSADAEVSQYSHSRFVPRSLDRLWEICTHNYPRLRINTEREKKQLYKNTSQNMITTVLRN